MEKTKGFWENRRVKRRGQKWLCQRLISRNVTFKSQKYKCYFMALAKHPLAQRYLILTSVKRRAIPLTGRNVTPDALKYNKGTIKICSFKQATKVHTICSVSRVTHWKYPLGDHYSPERIFSFKLLHFVFTTFSPIWWQKQVLVAEAGCCQNHMMVDRAEASQLLTNGMKTTRVWGGRGH